MDFKLVGSILLIVGTSIGAGMLALPIATAQLGFVGSVILLFSCWFVMTMGAFYILEANLWLPLNSNLVSMSRATLGPLGQIIAWLSFLLLLYSLLCAYIAGGSDLFRNLLMSNHIELTRATSSILFTLIFSAIVFLGIHAVDYTNRVLMFVKLGTYCLLIALLLPFISSSKLIAGDLYYVTASAAVMVTITSFGYASIVPSLRIYFAGDIHKLKIAVLVGSLIPLVCYLFWDMVIMGIIPLQGEPGLISILNGKDSTSDLVNTLNITMGKTSVTIFTKLFTSICVLTSFLGVSLCLTDFLADGFGLEKKGAINRLTIQTCTFLPPLVIVLFFPNIFVSALNYAGIYSVVLLVLLPAWMVWRGRYHRHIAKGFRVFGGKPMLAGILMVSVLLLVQGITNL